MESQPIKPIPKRSCIITIMFAIETDADALHVKEIIDKAVENIEEKRYTFQINES